MEITKEQVQAAVLKCPQAKPVLQELFPQYFEEVPEIKPFYVDQVTTGSMIFIAMGLAPEGLLNRCFGLSKSYRWSLEEKDGYQILIPKLKK